MRFASWNRPMGLAVCMGLMTWVVPTVASATRARMAAAPAAWHRLTWCTAAAAPFTLMMPGAWAPIR